MKPVFHKKNQIALFKGNSLKVLKKLKSNSVDSIVTDAPYGLNSKEPDMTQVLAKWLSGEDYIAQGKGFMGKSWDSFVPGPAIWKECLRVLKPGGHMLVFFGSRTYDMGTLAIRLAGFEIRDQIMWVYGSGFPKSLNVSKAIDKNAGADRVALGQVVRSRGVGKGKTVSQSGGNKSGISQITAPASDAASEWDGWGTALKPAHEPICVARKPLVGTVVANVLKHRTGALNIDACRTGVSGNRTNSSAANLQRVGVSSGMTKGTNTVFRECGRWPSNLIHDGSEEATKLFPNSNGSGKARVLKRNELPDTGWGSYTAEYQSQLRDSGSGSAARFFYCAKTSKADREDGNAHPTVKPTELMRYLVRLVTPKGGLVLDPFMGSGSTGKGALLEGMRFIGIDITPEYVTIAVTRLSKLLKKTKSLFMKGKK